MRLGGVRRACTVVAVATCAGAAALSTSVPASAAARPVSSSELIRLATSGRGLDEQGITVTGTVDLAPVGTLTRPFRCLDCQFLGRFLAPDVVFQRIVVLSGSHFHDRIDLRGAVFQGGLFVRTSRGPSVFDGFALFSLSTIDDVAAFDGATFHDEGNFTGARFGGDASFVDTRFDTVGRFAQASFAGSALFFTAPAPGIVPLRGCRTPVPGTFGRG